VEEENRHISASRLILSAENATTKRQYLVSASSLLHLLVSSMLPASSAIAYAL